jgi:hypothetical protein
LQQPAWLVRYGLLKRGLKRTAKYRVIELCLEQCMWHRGISFCVAILFRSVRETAIPCR